MVSIFPYLAELDSEHVSLDMQPGTVDVNGKIYQIVANIYMPHLLEYHVIRGVPIYGGGGNGPCPPRAPKAPSAIARFKDALRYSGALLVSGIALARGVLSGHSVQAPSCILSFVPL